MAHVALESPDRVALVEADSGRRVTWAQLDAEVDRVANALNAAGLLAGYRILLALGNRVEFVTCYLGALRARLVVVPVNPRAATLLGGHQRPSSETSASASVIAEAIQIASRWEARPVSAVTSTRSPRAARSLICASR